MLRRTSGDGLGQTQMRARSNGFGAEVMQFRAVYADWQLYCGYVENVVWLPITYSFSGVHIRLFKC